jgi:hypothetical protein
MGTRSTIALEFADGTVGQVYCHWDGYLEHNGKILFENYSDPFKLRDLIDQGDISSLKPEIGTKHPFSQFETDLTYTGFADLYDNMTTFYGRDLGEEGTEARYFKDFADYKANHQREEYAYILRTDGQWYVAIGRGVYIKLASALDTTENREAAIAAFAKLG